MQPEVIAIICILTLFVVLEILFTKFFKKPGQTREDAVVEILGSAMLLIVTQPLALFLGGAAACFFNTSIPRYFNRVAPFGCARSIPRF